jgi:hypothetical protein
MATKVKSRVSSSVKLGVAVALFIAVVAAAGVYYTVPKIQKVFDDDANYTKWSYLDESLGGNNYYPNKTMPKTNPLYLDGKGGVQTIKVVPGQQISINVKSPFKAKKIRFAFDSFQVLPGSNWQAALPDLDQVVDSFTGPNSANNFGKKPNYIFDVPLNAQIGDKYDVLVGMIKKQNKPQIEWAGVDDWSFLRYEVVTDAPATATFFEGRPTSNLLIPGNNIKMLNFGISAEGGDVNLSEAGFTFKTAPSLQGVEVRLYETSSGVAVTDWFTATKKFNLVTDVVIPEGNTKWFTVKANILQRLNTGQTVQFCAKKKNFVVQDMVSGSYDSLKNDLGLYCNVKTK